jgi:tetratricopeptide (TPR) repeat protein
MFRVWKLASCWNGSQCLWIGACLTITACGEVKVVDRTSEIQKLNPLNEIVTNSIDTGEVQDVGCLQILSPVVGGEAVLSQVDQDVFARATRAHLAPLEYPISLECSHLFQLRINQYSVQDFVVASRLIVDLSGEVRESSDGRIIWSADYRLAQNAGSIPLDPISLGMGAVSAANNSSEMSQENGIYLAMRRLLMALPEHRGSSLRTEKSEPSLSQEEPTSGSFSEALALWQEGRLEEALAVLSELYTEASRSQLGYEYGLMLEAAAQDRRAAEVYAETAVTQLRESQYESALQTLRRLERLNDAVGGSFSTLLDQALEQVPDL